jgi:hypothetical protein
MLVTLKNFAFIIQNSDIAKNSTAKNCSFWASILHIRISS